ncbi:putative transcriptional regulator, MerR family [Desulfovibrio sp. X2]|uniref:SAM-dependent methyltransferase n=1 Tax=Desulfovibrio sp. X2 TaxID=941449 RepID=UPI000358C0CB|nr:SAM-dependent methyltransferase [Desulfovibrio sp. X2]EPR37207.1 putative transcriptional regulator, MerR family [Desulfovibrio sp. X2]
MPIKTGKLARLTGITMRTLHHYDHIGLLTPSERTASGFRLYGQDDVRRLHAIQALKQIGCSLAEVRAVLDDPAISFPDIVDRQLHDLDERIERAQDLRARLARLKDRIARGGSANARDCLEVLEMMALYEKHLSRDEVAALRRNREAAGPDAGPAWRRLLDAAAAAMRRGVAPGDEEARRLAGEWLVLLRAATGGDLALAAGLRTVHERETRAREISGVTPELIDWLSRAAAALRDGRDADESAETPPADIPAAPVPVAPVPVAPVPTGLPEPKPSAMRVAVLRAAHQLLDTPRIFDDPLALTVLGEAEEAALRQGVERYTQSPYPSLRASVVARSRLAEDEWDAARRRGVRQCVVLGAGLDTFACRHREDAGCRIFEVDLAETQAWKRRLLRRSGIAEPENAVYVPLDLEASPGSGALAEALARGGFERGAPAFFSWLGVTMYIGQAAIMDTLGFVASCAPGGGVVFDYAVAPQHLGSRERTGREMVERWAASHGEPWKTDFVPDELTAALTGLGFSRVENLAPAELNARAFAAHGSSLHKSGVTRLVCARL